MDPLGPASIWTPVTCLPPVCHAAYLSETASSPEAEFQVQEGDGCASCRLRCQEAITVRLEEYTGETAPVITHTR